MGLNPKKRGQEFVVRAPLQEPHYIVPRETIDREWQLLVEKVLEKTDRLLKALPARLESLIAAEPAKRRQIISREIRRTRWEIRATQEVMMLDRVAEVPSSGVTTPTERVGRAAVSLPVNGKSKPEQPK